MSCVPPFGPVSEHPLLHLELSQDAAADCHMMNMDHDENWAKNMAQRSGNCGTACLVPATTTTMCSESTSLKSSLLQHCLLRAGGMLL